MSFVKVATVKSATVKSILYFRHTWKFVQILQFFSPADLNINRFRGVFFFAKICRVSDSLGYSAL